MAKSTTLRNAGRLLSRFRADTAAAALLSSTEEERRRAAAPERHSTSTVPLAERFSVPIPLACQAIGIGRSSLYEMIRAGEVETIKVAGRRLVLVRSLRALVGDAQ